MNNKFNPSINGIYFKNFDLIEDHNGVKHIRGDMYTSSSDGNEQCIGYFNPAYQAEPNDTPQYFLRLEEDFKYLYDSEGKYESIFNKYAVPLSESDCPVGFQELISDLELITYLYTFLHTIIPNDDFDSVGMIGIINATDEKPIINALKIKDSTQRSNEQIIEFINDNVKSLHLNLSYPVKLFKHQNDFTVWQKNGKILDFVTTGE